MSIQSYDISVLVKDVTRKICKGVVMYSIHELKNLLCFNNNFTTTLNMNKLMFQLKNEKTLQEHKISVTIRNNHVYFFEFTKRPK